MSISSFEVSSAISHERRDEKRQTDGVPLNISSLSAECLLNALHNHSGTTQR